MGTEVVDAVVDARKTTAVSSAVAETDPLDRIPAFVVDSASVDPSAAAMREMIQYESSDLNDEHLRALRKIEIDTALFVLESKKEAHRLDISEREAALARVAREQDTLNHKWSREEAIAAANGVVEKSRGDRLFKLVIFIPVSCFTIFAIATACQGAGLCRFEKEIFSAVLIGCGIGFSPIGLLTLHYFPIALPEWVTKAVKSIIKQ